MGTDREESSAREPPSEVSATSFEKTKPIDETAAFRIVGMDGELRIVSASRSFYETFAVQPAETEGRLLYEIGQRQWDIPSLRHVLEDILHRNSEFKDFGVEHVFPTIGHKALLLNARRIAPKDQRGSLILPAMEDITGSPSREDNSR